MNREDIIRMAREAGGLPDPMVFIGAYERFAALVLANNPPSTSWQEGCAFGRMAEREACAKVCEEQEDDGGEWDIQQQCANAIRARGNT